MTFIRLVESLLKALGSDYARRKRECDQERIDRVYNEANEYAKQRCRDHMTPYDPKTDGTFNNILDGCE